MVNHSLFKLILFLCAGAVAMGAHSLRLNDIRGLGRGRPLLHFIFLSGMLGITGVPLWSGFASKTLLHEALADFIHILGGGAWAYTAAEWLFVLAGGLTVAYMLKLYLCLFWQRGMQTQAERTPAFSKGSAVLLSGCAAAVWGIGLFPGVIVEGVGRLSAEFFQAEAEPIAYFTAETLESAGTSIGVGLMTYFAVVRGWLSEKTAAGRVYIDRLPAWMDLENSVYRPAWNAAWMVLAWAGWLVASLPEFVIAGGRRILLRVRAWRVPMPGGNKFTFAAGGFLNAVVAILNKTVRKHKPLELDFTCALAATNEEINRSMRRLKRSMSYSLLLFCIGLFLLLGYLMLW